MLSAPGNLYKLKDGVVTTFTGKDGIPQSRVLDLLEDRQGGIWLGTERDAGTGNIDADPLFVDAANGDLRLPAGSPCIDAGSNALLPPDSTDLDQDSDTAEPLPLDLDGNPRIGGGTVDMGAFELGIGLFNQSPVAQCQNVTVSAGAACTANASIDDGSFDPDSGDTISITQSPAGPYPLGSTTVTLTVTDSHGASSSCTATVTVVDQTAPTISCPVNIVTYLPPNTIDTSKLVTYPAPTATDNCGSASVTASQASGSAFPVGTTTVNVTATDAAGNQAMCSFTVTVLYNFSGFFQPVDNQPTVNVANAGSAIPVKFSLSGNKGLNIFAAGYPISQDIACNFTGDTSGIEETVTAGSSSLSYDATTDQYKYVWKTERAWRGTCRQLVVKLNDGTTHVANFQFR